MDKSFDIEKLIFFKFSLDEDRMDGYYTDLREQGAGRDWQKALEKIWKAFDEKLPNSIHPCIGYPGRYKKLSIEIPGNGKKNLLIFGINSGARFKKDTRPIVFPEGNADNVFGDSFILAPDVKNGRMKVIDPENDPASFPDDSWAAVSYDESKLNKATKSIFAFKIDYIEAPMAPPEGEALMAPPEDAWPGPPHNSSG